MHLLQVAVENPLVCCNRQPGNASPLHRGMSPVCQMVVTGEEVKL